MKYFDDIVNPIAEARLADGYSLKRLGKRLDMSAQYISSAEHGTYSDLNDDLVRYVADVLDVPNNVVMHLYKQFQEATRRRTARNLKPRKLKRGTQLTPGHVLFANWRAAYWPSPVSFANAFCVHPEVVRSYEEGIRANIPNQIRKALESVDLLEEDWSETRRPRQSVFGPMRKTSKANAITIPQQRAQEPF